MAKRTKRAAKQGATQEPRVQAPSSGLPAPLASVQPVVGALVRSDDGSYACTERAYGAAEALAAAGLSNAAIAAFLGCSPGTLRKLRDRDERLDAAMARGLAANEVELLGVLQAAARKGMFVPAIFLLKARHGYREGDAPDTRPNVVINLPDALPMDQYMARLRASQQRVLDQKDDDDAPAR